MPLPLVCSTQAKFLVKNWRGGWGGRCWHYLCQIQDQKTGRTESFLSGQSLGSASLDLSEGHSAQHAARKDGSLSHLLAGPSVGGLCSQPGSSKRWLSRPHASVAREFSLHPKHGDGDSARLSNTPGALQWATDCPVRNQCVQGCPCPHLN